MPVKKKVIKKAIKPKKKVIAKTAPAKRRKTSPIDKALKIQVALLKKQAAQAKRKLKTVKKRVTKARRMLKPRKRRPSL
jgi:hypothetical protein